MRPPPRAPTMRRLLRSLVPQRRSAASPAALCPSPLTTDEAPAPLTGLWPAVLERARAAASDGALVSTATTPSLVDDGGWTFVLRVARSLQAKTEAAAAQAQKAKKQEGKSRAFNPFDPPDPRLVVTPLPPSHTLVLNKFNVADGHVLIITQAFEPQEAPLTPADAAAAWAVVTSFPGAGGLLYFNRGPLSGASQPHKHVQVVPLPLDAAEAGSDDTARAPFEGAALASVTAAGAPQLTVTPVRSLPVCGYAASMPPAPGPTPTQLAACLGDLAAACGVEGGSDAATSYNLVLTRRCALAVPRSAAGVGPVGVNAIGYAGSLLVRTETELEYVREAGPWGVLRACGVPW